MICEFCRDREGGCIACPGEKTEPTLPEPIFTAKFDSEHDMKLSEEYFGRESIESGVIPGVYPALSSDENNWELRGALASFLQAVHKDAESTDETPEQTDE